MKRNIALSMGLLAFIMMISIAITNLVSPHPITHCPGKPKLAIMWNGQSYVVGRLHRGKYEIGVDELFPRFESYEEARKHKDKLHAEARSIKLEKRREGYRAEKFSKECKDWERVVDPSPSPSSKYWYTVPTFSGDGVITWNGTLSSSKSTPGTFPTPIPVLRNNSDSGNITCCPCPTPSPTPTPSATLHSSLIILNSVDRPPIDIHGP